MHTNSLAIRPANFTRTSSDFVAKFRREGRFHFIPLYWLLRLSDLAREGMERSGSYTFADHLYRNVPSGKGVLGRLLDALLLQMPATRAMRQRCFEATAAMLECFEKHQAIHQTPFHLMSVPCGIPRDVRNFAQSLATSSRGESVRRRVNIHYTALDIDPAVIHDARAFLDESREIDCKFIQGDALTPDTLPDSQHFVSSTGLGEFLDDAQLESFYANVHQSLEPGGTFFTSATAQGKGSDILLRAFELHAHYRTESQLRGILSRFPWSELRFSHDQTGLQTFVRATR